MGKNKNFLRLMSLFAFVGVLLLLISLTSDNLPSNDSSLPTLAVLPSSSAISQNTTSFSATSIPNNVNTSITGTTAVPVALVIPENPVPDQIVIRFAPNTSAEQRAAYLQSINANIVSDLSALDTVIVTVPSNTNISSLPASPIVLSSEADYYAVAQQEISSNDPQYAQQWALPVINAPSAWAELPNVSVTVAVIDSGICAQHADLQGRILAGYDFVESDNVPQDAFGHGCGVAGIIAANTNNSIGISGIAPNAEILPLRVLNAQGVGTYSDVASAIIYAVDNGARIINLSLGGIQPSNLLENAVNYATERNVTVIAAAGNTGNRVLYPAAYPAVIAVGSIDRSMQTSSFTPTAQIDLFAPGRDILSLNLDGSYSLMTGTSFAAPQVAGIAALEIAYGRTLTLDGGVANFGGANTSVVIAPTSTPSSSSTQYADLINTAHTRGSVRVIVSLNVNFQPEGLLSPQAIQSQQAMIAQAQQGLMSALSGYNVTLLSQSDQWVIPGIAYQVDEAALLYLMSLPDVVDLVEDTPMEQALNTSAGVVDAPEAWTMGYTGIGQTVVILDSGIDATHPNFGGRVVAQACYSWNQPDNPGSVDYNERNDSLCANSDVQQMGTGAANLSRCTFFGVDCNHGTHVAGIAAGGDNTYRGIAPNANIVAIQVFTRWEDCPSLAGVQQCILSYSADQISALNYVYTTLRESYNIAAINISIGVERFLTNCDTRNIQMTNIIDQLYAANIATVIASSNNGYSDSISFPACITSAISVASTNDNNVMSSFSNAAAILDLVAPGDNIMSSLPGNLFGSKTGTSMATPHVVGAWALLRQAVPSMTVEQGLNALRTTGFPVLDSRNSITFRRIDIDDAIASFFAPTPVPSGYHIMTISDQALLNRMQALPNTPLHVILVVITSNQLNVYVDLAGTTAVVAIQIEQGNRVIAMNINSITDVNGEASNATIVEAVNTYLPALLTGALDQIIGAQFGGTANAEDMTLYNNYLSIGVTLP